MELDEDFLQAMEYAMHRQRPWDGRRPRRHADPGRSILETLPFRWPSPLGGSQPTVNYAVHDDVVTSWLKIRCFRQ